MNERDVVLSELIGEVLGPRGGPFEVLLNAQNPRSEYINGILTPRSAREGPDIEANAELLEGAEDSDADDDADDPAAVSMPATSFTPALDPRALPHSIGLSFVIESNGKPAIEVCTTWARYKSAGLSNDWRREPEARVIELVDFPESTRRDLGSGAALYLRSHTIDDRRRRVSLYLVNELTPVDPERIATDELIFQPQIRVNGTSGSRIVPLARERRVPTVNGSGAIGEEESLELLFRQRRPKARGHMCGAVWKEIDPERPHPARPLPSQPPYHWIDSEVVEPIVASRFNPPDVRTEFVPCYPVRAPRMDWREDIAPRLPVLDPLELSELWDAHAMRSALEPLVDGYAAWIAGETRKIPGLESEHQAAALDHVKRCKKAQERISAGIELIATDDDVRLAFCFANRAIALQSGWSRNGTVVPWRPFQLAFILLNVSGIADRHHSDRDICDLLWFPTGGGKTEAYLGLAAFTLALRRRQSPADQDGHKTGIGVGVISRYTLRLLTIQQFRRALGVVTACEFLRVEQLGQTSGQVGWRPLACPVNEDFLWGTSRFSVGLWVGGSVTPNGLHPVEYTDRQGRFQHHAGALELLVNPRARGEGEPAQVVTCPVCRNAVLAVAREGFERGDHQVHLTLSNIDRLSAPPTSALAFPGVNVVRAQMTPCSGPRTATFTIDFNVTSDGLSLEQLEAWWVRILEPALRSAGNPDVELACASPGRPGYFLRMYTNQLRNERPCDFDIYCPNPECPLSAREWVEKVPVSVGSSSAPRTGAGEWQEVPPPFALPGTGSRSSRMPIPALTVDDQIYHRVPSLVVATADKFARLSFEPKAASLFGNVDRYHSRWGFYRCWCPPADDQGLPAAARMDPPGLRGRELHRSVERFPPPDLILQDELHLIEGPLGSMVGLYETAIDLLSQWTLAGDIVKAKYVASTATVRQAQDQVQALFGRSLSQFPSPGLDIDDNFFAHSEPAHPLDADRAGRLYAAIAAPARGAQTPIVRIWSSLLQTPFQRKIAGVNLDEIDGFWTLVGYFNAIRELAGARALYGQDIREWMDYRANQKGNAPRPLQTDELRPIELSSRADSLLLPGLLEQLAVPLDRGDPEDAVLSTSMFGTGVDIDRLDLMVVHGQPKTTASYIQATGRVGRRRGGLVVVFLRASRPRDLDHYEFFTGYHVALYAHVEPITVAPFSPRARERALGPVSVALLRQADQIAGHPVPPDLKIEQRIRGGRFSGAGDLHPNWPAPAIQAIMDMLEARASTQPPERRPPGAQTHSEARAWLDRWRNLAQLFPGQGGLIYHESSLVNPPSHPVVLGDPHHELAGLDVAFRNAPTSLRDVEATTRFGD